MIDASTIFYNRTGRKTMSEILKTVKVKRNGSRKGYHIINESDFDASVHVKLDDSAKEPAAKEPAAKEPASVPLDQMTMAELKAVADELGIKWNTNWQAHRLISEIEAKRAAS